MSRARFARLRVACYRLAILLALIELVLTTSVLNLRRHKRAIGRLQWNMTDNYIPSYLMLLSREPLDQPTNTAAFGNPDDFPVEIKRDPYEHVRYAYDGYFAGIGIILRNSSREQYVMANVEAMLRASTRYEDGSEYTGVLRGFDMIKKNPIMNPLATTWHELEDSLNIRHLMTFGYTGFGLFGIKIPSEPKSRTTSNLEGKDPILVRNSRTADYKHCWAYSMMHHYYIEKSDVHEGGQFEDLQVKRFWGRWPVQLVDCNKAQVCQFVFDRSNWYEDPLLELNSTVMPDELTSQGFPCGWQDVGAPIFCALRKSDAFEEDAIKRMQLRFLVLRGRKPDPTKRPLKGKFAADCYEEHEWHGNFTAFSLDTAMAWIQKHINQFADSRPRN